MDKKLKSYTCIDHDSVWVGGASIVIARDEKQGRSFLNKALRQIGLKPFKEHPYTLKQINMDKAKAIILLDGDY